MRIRCRQFEIQLPVRALFPCRMLHDKASKAVMHLEGAQRQQAPELVLADTLRG